MTEANLNLQSSWPSYQSHEQVYCLHSLAKSVHNFRKNELTYSYAWCNLIRRRVRQGITMHTIRGKASCTLTYLAQDTWYCLHRFNRVRNLEYESTAMNDFMRSVKHCTQVLIVSAHCVTGAVGLPT